MKVGIDSKDLEQTR